MALKVLPLVIARFSSLYISGFGKGFLDVYAEISKSLNWRK
jgi:hypothetical protein